MATTSIRPESIDRQERTRALLQELERGFQSVKESERYIEYLKFCARFHDYSPHNCLLIMLQRPLASNVAGFNTWKSMGRYVRKGEKGIQILAPRPYRRTSENDEGEEETTEGVYFHPVHVFDVAQTDGAELPSPNDRLTGDDNGLFHALRTLALKERLTVDQQANETTTANGYYRKADRRIWVRPDMSPAQSAKTLAHELAHHFAEHDVNGHCRNEAETIAESAAYVILAHFGIDAGAYSFGYLASWTDTKTFKAALREVQHVAQRIIDGLGRSEAKHSGPTETAIRPSEPISVPVAITKPATLPVRALRQPATEWRRPRILTPGKDHRRTAGKATFCGRGAATKCTSTAYWGVPIWTADPDDIVAAQSIGTMLQAIGFKLGVAGGSPFVSWPHRLTPERPAYFGGPTLSQIHEIKAKQALGEPLAKAA